MLVWGGWFQGPRVKWGMVKSVDTLQDFVDQMPTSEV